MRDNHTREQEGYNGVQGLKALVGGMTTVEGGGKGDSVLFKNDTKFRTAKLVLFIVMS